jgi:2-polyprenyl-6-hydroxyphenyl methylase/3-demethylubiquinone-9 3-methyltransferase
MSTWFDNMLPPAFSTDGNSWFVRTLVPQFLKPGLRVCDVGGGKNPLVDRVEKARLGLRVVGIDIDASELAQAAEGTYDQAIAADICQFRGDGTSDLVICQALLEHVPNVEQALKALASIVRPGGTVLIFVPCRNAFFARLNLLLPQEWKKRILYAIWPNTKRDQGFPAYYDRCTPGDFRRLTASAGLRTVAEYPYFRCGYFGFFFPFHLAWRLWSACGYLLVGAQAAETFCLVLEKSPAAATASAA